MSRLLFLLGALLGALTPLIFDSALKGAALLAVAAVCALLFWRASAAARHLLWLVAVVALLIVPVLSFALPQWRVLPTWAASPGADAAAPATNDRTDRSDRSDPPQPPPLGQTPPALAPAPGPWPPPASPAPPPAASAPEPAFRDWLPLAWSAGFTLLSLRLLAAHLLLRRSARRCSRDETFASALSGACRQLAIRQRVTLLLDERRTIPVVWGVFRPRLLLPAEAREWTAEQLRSVLLHELAHVKRRDALTQWLTQIACALHWWNPLVWLAAWRLHVERERACDDLVLASGVRPSAYAGHLLHVATKLSPARWTSACGLAMARKSLLEGRLVAVLSEKRNRRSVSAALAAIALAAGAGIAIPIAMLRAADKATPPASTPDSFPLSPSTLLSPSRIGGITTTADAAEISVDEKRGAIAFVAGEGKSARVVVHSFSASREKIVFRVSADDRQGKWWDQARLVRAGESDALFPELPADWLPHGRVVFPGEPVKREDDAVVFAEIESAAGKSPLAVRAATRSEGGEADYLLMPRTCPELAIVLDCRIHALATKAPERNVLLPVMAAQDLTGVPRTALSFPRQTLRPGIPGYWNRMAHGAETMDVTATLVGRRVRVTGSAIVRIPDGKYSGAAEAWRKNEESLHDDLPVTRRELRAEFSATLGGNDALVVPIPSEGMFPDTLVASMTALAWPVARVRWLPPESRSPIALDGWVLTWPRSEREWLASLFDYDGIPDMIAHAVEGRKDTAMKGITSEAVGTMEQDEVEKLLAGFRRRSGVTAERVEPFSAKQNITGFPATEDRTHFSAAGEGASVLPRAGERDVSLNLHWDAPVSRHLSAGDAYGLRSGTSLCILLPGPAEPEKIRMLVLRCTDPDAPERQRVPMPKPAAERSQEGAQNDPAKIWTPGELIEKGGKRLRDNVTEFVVEFRVDAVAMHPTIFPDGTKRDVPHLVPADWTFKDGFSVPISIEAEAELKQKGIGDLRAHFAGKVIRVKGKVSETGLDLIGQPSIWSYHVSLRSLDQLLEVRDDDPKPAEPKVDAKLPDDALWKTKAPFEKIPVTIAEWSEAKNGLRLGMRVAADDGWRLGAKVKVELWLHNAGAKDATFNANPGRADVGLAVAAKDSEGSDHWAESGNVAIVAIPLACVLPAGHVAKVKDFELSFDAPGNTEVAWFSPKFRELAPGKYELRCVWSDAHPSVSGADFWTGELSTGEVDFTLAAEAAPNAGAAAKLKPETLIGFWRGEMDGERIAVSFHRPPADAAVQVDVYFGEATIGALMSFAIAPDGSAVTLMNGRGGANAAEYGRLTPGEAGTLQLEVTNKQTGQTRCVLTRDADDPGLEPRQKEPRALFAIWEKSATAEGKIPGALIGKFAEEVKTYVKANPTLHSAMKLPKLLPRFDASRDWTPAEVVALLNDVAHYSTQPIEALMAGDAGAPAKDADTEAEAAPSKEEAKRRIAELDETLAKLRARRSEKEKVLGAKHPELLALAGEIHEAVKARISLAPFASPRSSLPDSAYKNSGVPDRGDPAIVWGPEKNGLRAGHSPEFWRKEWRLGDEFQFNVWLACVGKEAVTFSLQQESPQGLRVLLTGADGLVHDARDRNFGLSLHPNSHHRLQPGERMKLQTVLFRLAAKPKLGGNRFEGVGSMGMKTIHRSSGIAPVLTIGPATILPPEQWTATLPPGAYTFEFVLQIPGREGGPAKDEWAGALHSAPTKVEVMDSESDTTESPRKEEAEPEAQSTDQAGRWNLGDGIRLEVASLPAAEGEPRAVAIIHWPAKNDRPALRHEVPLGEAGAWIMAWEKNGQALCIADPSTVRQIHFDDPAQIRTDLAGRNNNTNFSEIPAAVRAALEKRYALGRQPNADGFTGIGGNRGGQQFASAMTEAGWTVEGRVADESGQPLGGVPVEVHTEYKPLEAIAKARTDEKGRYALSFRTDLETLAKWRGVMIEPKTSDRALSEAGAGEFTMRLTADEPVEKPFGARSLVLGGTARADFTLEPAATVEGVIVGADGQPLANAFIALRTPDQRPGYSVTSTTAGADGRFRLTGVPGGRKLTLVAAIDPSKEARIENRSFAADGTHRLRLTLAPDESGRWSVKIEPEENAKGKPEASGKPGDERAKLDGPAADGPGRIAPGEASMKTLILNTLLLFNDAIQKKSFADFYQEIARTWQDVVNADQLKSAFQPFIDRQVDLSGIKALDCILERPPAVDSDGVLLAFGFFPAKPGRITFSLKYVHEAESWKLSGIDLRLTAASADEARKPWTASGAAKRESKSK